MFPSQFPYSLQNSQLLGRNYLSPQPPTLPFYPPYLLSNNPSLPQTSSQSINHTRPPARITRTQQNPNHYLTLYKEVYKTIKENGYWPVIGGGATSGEYKILRQYCKYFYEKDKILSHILEKDANGNQFHITKIKQIPKLFMESHKTIRDLNSDVYNQIGLDNKTNDGYKKLVNILATDLFEDNTTDLHKFIRENTAPLPPSNNKRPRDEMSTSAGDDTSHPSSSKMAKLDNTVSPNTPTASLEDDEDDDAPFQYRRPVKEIGIQLKPEWTLKQSRRSENIKFKNTITGKKTEHLKLSMLVSLPPGFSPS